jgi:signal transduction histidine kinase/ligand-binding sensor domain-containing protein
LFRARIPLLPTKDSHRGVFEWGAPTRSARIWSFSTWRLFALFLFAQSSWALDPSQPASSYLQTTFTVADGLPSNVVNAIAQTASGFLWLGTDDGLSKFNGRRFARVGFRGTAATPQGVVRSLAVSPEGDLWVGTDTGLARIPSSDLDHFDPSLVKFYHPGFGKRDEILCLRFGRDGVLWVGTRLGLFRWQDGRFQTVLADAWVSRMEEAPNGHLLVINGHDWSELDGLQEIPHVDVAARLGVKPNEIFHVVPDRSGALWFCTVAGVARKVGNTIVRVQPYSRVTRSGAFRAMEDAQGNIWVFTQGGLFRATASGLELLAAGMNAASVFSDRDGTLWVGRKGDGLVKFKDRSVQIFKPIPQMLNTRPMTVLSDRSGRLWVGSSCGGLSLFDGRGFKTYDEKDGLKNSCVNTIAEDADQSLWLGTGGGGLFRFKGAKFTQYDPRQGLPSIFVYSVTVSSDGSLWIGTEDGLSHMRDNSFRNYTTADGLASNRVVNAFEDREGGIWVATALGVDRMRDDRFVHVPSETLSLGHRSIGFAETSSGEIYVLGAPRGISRVQDRRLVNLNPELELLAMLQLGPNDVWLTGANGIFRFPASQLGWVPQEHEGAVDYEQFGPADGLVSAQSSPGVPNLAATPDGRLWVATAHGVAMLDLAHLQRTDRKPRVYVDEVTIGRNTQPAQRELVLAPGTYHIAVHFDTVELASPEKIRFQYRFDGVDSLWLDADATRSAVYTKIPIGNHLFHIRACNSYGVWDRIGSTYSINQSPYYFETLWFRSLSLASGLGLLAGAYFFRLGQMRHQMRIRLEERLDERERIARELHDTLLQSVQGLIFRFHAIAERLPEKEATRGEMEHTLDRANQVLAEGRDRVGSLRVFTETGADLAQLLAAAAKEIIQNSQMEFGIVVAGKPRPMNAIAREEAYWIGREALMNAVRHSQGRSIAIEITYAERELRLRIRDDGQGIDRSTLGAVGQQKHWGLVGMRERAQKIRSRLEVLSRADNGTEVDLDVPAAVAYKRSLNGSHEKPWYLFGGQRG